MMAGWWLLVLGCSGKGEDEGGAITATPSTLSQFGGEEITLEVSAAGIDPAAVTAVTIQGVPLLSLRAEGAGVVGWAQGAPEPGESDVVVWVGAEAHTAPAAVTFTAPEIPALERVVAIGASVSMGFDAGGWEPASALHSPPAQLARAVGAYLGVPLLKEGLAPPIDPASVPADTCAHLSYADHFLSVLPTLTAAMQGPDGLDAGRARQNPDIEVRNFGVAGTDAFEILDPPTDLAETIFSHLVYEPSGAPTAPVSEAQVARAEALAPTTILVTDLFGNHLIDALTSDGPIRPEEMAPVEEVQPYMVALLDRLEATGAWVVIGNTPHISLLPLTVDRVRDMRAAGASEEEIAAAIAALDDRVDAYNAALDAAAAGRERIVVVDFAHQAEVFAAGVEVDGEALSSAPYQGLIGLDGLHFSWTASALAAQVLLDTLGARAGFPPPTLDLSAVHAEDPSSPTALAARGLPAACR